MKESLAIIFNDVHLKTGNEQEVINAIKHMIKYAKKSKIDKLIFAGDLFDSRSFQRQSVLLAFDKILNLLHEAGLTLYLFPGNHDKTVYKSFDSFLDVYRYYPGVKLNRASENIVISDIKITLLPFFSDDMLIPMLKEHEGGDVLISHFEMAGSTHLGQTSKKTSINKKLLSKWKKTYLGHYHNYHEITKDIVHLPSFRQSSFGEDNHKGFTVLYKDLSYEIILGEFREFRKVKIDINTTSNKEIKELIELHRNSKDTVRFEFTGDESKLKALDKSQFNKTGIDIKVKYEAKYDYSDTKIEAPEIIEEFGEEQIRDSFKKFCEDKGYNHKEGEELLDNFLNEKNGEEKK